MKAIYVLAAIASVATAISQVSFPPEFETKKLATVTICPEVKFVAREEGKYFFADATRRTWAATSSFCKSMGMKLASIMSSRQWSTLSAAYSPTNFNGYFWTSGRDALALRQFSWNETDVSLNASYLVYSRYNSHNFQSCIALHSVPTGANLVSNTCSTGHYALCELN